MEREEEVGNACGAVVKTAAWVARVGGVGAHDVGEGCDELFLGGAVGEGRFVGEVAGEGCVGCHGLGVERRTGLVGGVCQSVAWWSRLT